MLSVSTTTSYALKASRCLAGGECATRHLADIARCTGIPGAYLAKVMRRLRQAGLVVSKRGYQGGLRLARAPGIIPLWDVIVAIEGPDWMGPCVLGLEHSAASGPCPIEALWRRICFVMQTELRRLTVADLLGPAAEPRESTTGGIDPFDSPPIRPGGSAGPLKPIDKSV